MATLDIFYLLISLLSCLSDIQLISDICPPNIQEGVICLPCINVEVVKKGDFNITIKINKHYELQGKIWKFFGLLSHTFNQDQEANKSKTENTKERQVTNANEHLQLDEQKKQNKQHTNHMKSISTDLLYSHE